LRLLRRNTLGWIDLEGAGEPEAAILIIPTFDAALPALHLRACLMEAAEEVVATVLVPVAVDPGKFMHAARACRQIAHRVEAAVRIFQAESSGTVAPGHAVIECIANQVAAALIVNDAGI
jgi:hypothetical protein